ncbi:MAG: helix-turn-helix domain-containing protein [Deltaproteobacteria bacterium]|nr:helix-turn-helix domain-containing protein [Deltaproteobacteria bacterium]
MDFPEVMDVKEASKYLGVKPDTIYRHIHSDKIPAFKLGGLWRFKKKVLDEWMENQSKNSKPRKRADRK